MLICLMVACTVFFARLRRSCNVYETSFANHPPIFCVPVTAVIACHVKECGLKRLKNGLKLFNAGVRGAGELQQLKLKGLSAKTLVAAAFAGDRLLLASDDGVVLVFNAPSMDQV